MRRIGGIGRWTTALLVLALATCAAPAGAQDWFPTTARAAQDQYGQPESQPAPQTGGGQGQRPAGEDGGSGREQSRDPGAGRGGGDGRAPGSGAGPAGTGTSPAGTTLPLRDAQGGRLPFTGLDLAALMLLGVLLVAAGCVLAAVARRRRVTA